MQAAIRQNFASDVFNYKKTEAKKERYPSISVSGQLKSSHHIMCYSLEQSPWFLNLSEK